MYVAFVQSNMQRGAKKLKTKHVPDMSGDELWNVLQQQPISSQLDNEIIFIPA